MSERQAKKIRKDRPEVQVKKPENKAKIITNLIAVLVILAVLALGIFATWDIIKAALPNGNNAAQQVQTVATVAESEGLTAEELLAKCDLTDSGLTADSTADEMLALLTVEKYAKFEDKTADELREEYGLGDVADDMPWQDAQLKMTMQKVAQKQFGVSFDEFKASQGLPEEITADMTQEEAMEILQSTLAAEENE